MADIRLGVDTKGLREVSRQLRTLEDGKDIRRMLAADLRAAAGPAVSDARSAIMAMPARGAASPALRSGIARRIVPEVHTTGRWTGARIRAAQTPELRGFRNAAKRTQNQRGWRHPTFGRTGRGDWATQQGKPFWFDRVMQRRMPEFSRAAGEVLEKYVRLVAKRVDGAGGH